MVTSKWAQQGGPTWKSQAETWESIQANGYKGEKFPVVTVGEQTLPDFTDRVLAGMDLLDKINPGWQDTLNLDTLDLEDDSRCVLGQSWEHYAKTRTLVDVAPRDRNDTEFRHYIDVVAPVTAEMNQHEIDEARMDFAASIGCALSDADFALINASCYHKFPNSGSLAGQMGSRLTHEVWEHLTKTWVREITKARQEGRWNDPASSASTEKAPSAPTAESTSTSSSEQMESVSS